MARGFFAEIQHQAKVAAREQAKADREAERRHNAAVRRAEQERKAAERAEKQLARAHVAEQKRLEKEAKDAHFAAMEADVERLNLELELNYEEIDSLLAATLGVDDFVDLEALKVVAEHPPFDRIDLEDPLPAPEAVPNPPEPALVVPPVPKGLGALFGKKRHAKAVEKAQTAHELAVAASREELAKIVTVNESALEKHAEAEAQRVGDLKRERTRYDAECSKRATLGSATRCGRQSRDGPCTSTRAGRCRLGRHPTWTPISPSCVRSCCWMARRTPRGADPPARAVPSSRGGIPRTVAFPADDLAGHRYFCRGGKHAIVDRPRGAVVAFLVGGRNGESPGVRALACDAGGLVRGRQLSTA